MIKLLLIVLISIVSISCSPEVNRMDSCLKAGGSFFVEGENESRNYCVYDLNDFRKVTK
jgi:hypothetical protein